MKNNQFTTAILGWYQQNKRTLPWRESQIPYHIWLSEIILQQTRVAQGLPYYNRFVKMYPSIHDLAKANEDEILRLWQGLGYYSRARNLHKCAKVVVREHEGIFPNTMKELLALPGIGRYTAAAIASLVYDEPVPVVDGNVYRVLSRYFAIDMDTSTSKTFSHFYQLSASLIDKLAPGDYNQAVMEFGALFCVPKNPDCKNCVLQHGCIAFNKSLQQHLPVKKKKPKPRKRYLYYFVVIKNDSILMRQRSEKDIWQGLYEFVLVEAAKLTSIDLLDHPVVTKIRSSEAKLEVNDKIFRHLLTHQLLYVNFVVVSIKSNSDLIKDLSESGFRWYDKKVREGLPKPVLISNFLDRELNSINLQ